MFGVDLYGRYNLVTDWHTLYADGIRDVYVKLSDGAGPAVLRGDSYVAGAHGIGCKVGGYHYLQPSPTPEKQAEVFAAELKRLRAQDLPPALDLEEPSIPPASRVDYARRFLLHLQSQLNISRVVLYASASWYQTLHPERWGIPGLIDWVASFGPNDGKQHAVTLYTGHVDAHQYTSAGHLAGVSGVVDLDVFPDNLAADPVAPPVVPPAPKGPLMALTDAQQQTVLDAANAILPGLAGVRSAGAVVSLLFAMQGQIAGLVAAVAALTEAAGSPITVAELTSIVDAAVVNSLEITGTVSVHGVAPAPR